MAVIDSQLDTQSDSYLTNFRVMSEAPVELLAA